jgi:hypothetical protein
VDQEGDPSKFFGALEVVETLNEDDDKGETIPINVTERNSVYKEHTFLLRSTGFDVDDDNNPAPENVPVAGGEVSNDQQAWGWSGVCNRKAYPLNENHPPCLVGMSEAAAKSQTFLSMFLLLFPLNYLHEVLLGELNKNLAKEKQRLIALGEFLRFLGIWLYMLTFKGFTRNQFWSSKPISDFEGAPDCLTEWMSKHRFVTIVSCLQYTNQPSPAYRDMFHRIHQLIEAWNDNMSEKFMPSGCLVSMSLCHLGPVNGLAPAGCLFLGNQSRL